MFSQIDDRDDNMVVPAHAFYIKLLFLFTRFFSWDVYDNGTSLFRGRGFLRSAAEAYLFVNDFCQKSATPASGSSS